jgi:hypothetical protein
MPIRRSRDGCCAHAANGMAAAVPASVLMKSRRRTDSSKGSNCADLTYFHEYSRKLVPAKWVQRQQF